MSSLQVPLRDNELFGGKGEESFLQGLEEIELLGKDQEEVHSITDADTDHAVPVGRQGDALDDLERKAPLAFLLGGGDIQVVL